MEDQNKPLVWLSWPKKFADDLTTRLCQLKECNKELYAKGLCNHHYQRFRHGRVNAETGEEIMREVNIEHFGPTADWVYIRSSKTFLNILTGERLDTSGCVLSYGRGIIDLLRAQKIKTYRGECFHPTETPHDMYNSFKIPESMEMIHEHTEEPLPDIRTLLNTLGGNNVEYLEMWLAHGIRNPGIVSTTLVLHGIPGSGKTTLAMLLSHIYGEMFATVNVSALENDFNGWLERKLMVVAEEITVSSFRDRERIQNILKNYMMGGNILINRKGVPQYQINNLARWMMFSNAKYPVVVEADDRRYSVIAQAKKLPTSVGQEINRDVKKYAANLKNYLATVDTSDFEAMRPLQNDDRRAVQEIASMHAAKVVKIN